MYLRGLIPPFVVLEYLLVLSSTTNIVYYYIQTIVGTVITKRHQLLSRRKPTTNNTTINTQVAGSHDSVKSTTSNQITIQLKQTLPNKYQRAIKHNPDSTISSQLLTASNNTTSPHHHITSNGRRRILPHDDVRPRASRAHPSPPEPRDPPSIIISITSITSISSPTSLPLEPLLLRQPLPLVNPSNNSNHYRRLNTKIWHNNHDIISC